MTLIREIEGKVKDLPEILALFVAALLSVAASARPPAYPGVKSSTEELAESVVDTAGASARDAFGFGSYVGKIFDTASEISGARGLPKAPNTLSWFSAAFDAADASEEFFKEGGNMWEGTYKALKAGVGLIPGWRGVLLKVAMNVAHLAGEGVAWIQYNSSRRKAIPTNLPPRENESVKGRTLPKVDSQQDAPNLNTSVDEKETDASQIGVRGWCTCPHRSARIVGGNLVKVGENFNVAEYCYFFCADCYKCRKDLNDVAHLVHDGPLVIWDVSIARQSFIDGTSRTIGMVKGEILDALLDSQKKIMSIPDGEIVVPGVCECDSPVIYRFGEEPNKIEMCTDCGRPRSAIPSSAKNPNSVRGLRRLSGCTCQGEVKVNPLFHTSMWDDGYAEFALQCAKCFKIRYSSLVYMSEFKKRFPSGTPDPMALLLFMIGTTDVKAAMKEADQKAVNQ